MNWEDIVRLLFLALLASLLYVSQRFVLREIFRWLGRKKTAGRGPAVRITRLALTGAACLFAIGWFTGVIPRSFRLLPLLSAWFASSLFAYLFVRAVAAAEWAWNRLPGRGAGWTERSEAWPGAARQQKTLPPANDSGVEPALENPSRRAFFRTAYCLAGAAPFVGALYGFAAERLRFKIERVEVPLAELPPGLDGLRIVQVSDLHAGTYLPVEQVRRAVAMANALGAELAVVTGDYITGEFDPLEDCVSELCRLRAPLGVWGCLGNHEIYADCEGRAASLFRQAGVRILRSESARIEWRGSALNLIGVDYQRSRTLSGERLEMLAGVEPLVRRDALNVLLSHNPNAFDRAAEMGLELTLAGHTHGGQVSVEILEQQFSPARFVTPYTSGLYERRVASFEAEATGGGPAARGSGLPAAGNPRSRFLYVNRGIGTVGPPVRLGATPEITLLTLRRKV